MENYEAIYEKAKTDLDKTKTEKAVVKEKIDDLADKLGLDKNGDLEEQIATETTKLEAKIAKHEAEIKSLVEEIEKL